YEQQEAIAFAVAEMMEQCGTTYAVEVCPLTTEAALNDAMQAKNTQPLVASDGTNVDGTLLFGYLVSTLYRLDHDRSEALATFGQALTGDQEAIDSIAAQMSGGGASVGASGMLVRCLSAPVNTNLAGLYHYIEERG